MILAFYLSMPNCASWNGRWSGEGRKYVIVKTFRGKKATEKAEGIRNKGNYYYSWPDGWGAAITVKEVNSSQATKLRRQSDGFSGYDWMVKTICQYGKPMASHEVKKYLQSQTVSAKPLIDR
jgi:hypothetical protein